MTAKMAPPTKGKNAKPNGKPDPARNADRVKALRLRTRVKVGAPLTPEEASWLGNYDSRVQGDGSVGGSRRRTVEATYREDEAEAVGTGEAAAVAAAGAYAREEGRRYDSMLDAVIKATETVTKMYAELGRVCLDRAKEDGQTLRELMVSVRHHYLEKTELEADAIRAAAEGDDDITKLSKLAEDLAPILGPMFGVKVEPKSNGAAYRRGRPA